ncbi:hypothetical protein [Chishuiella sp.]|uniref:hypothetical protein n=1 Tax=Chishuiella sp. TaxID=1969467 RepID=UPI0028ABE274|nr:hypothetical protein [Chishuiella sp.]
MSLEKLSKSELSITWNVLDIIQRTQNFNIEQSTNEVLENFDSIEKLKDRVMGELVKKISLKEVETF